MPPSNPKKPNQAKHARLLEQIKETYALFQQGQYTKAQTQITRILSKDPASAIAHTLAAMIAISLDQQDRALYHAQTAIKNDPKNTDALTTLASLHALRKEHQQAFDLYTKALSIQPNHPGALAGLGTAQSELGHYNDARATLKQVQSLNPNQPEPLVNRALLELDTTHAHRAIEILEAAPQAVANHPAALDLYALAHSYDDTKSPEQIFQAHKRYGDILESQIPPTKHPRPTSPNKTDPNKKLNIGYLSGDLHQHSITYFLEPILANTYKSKFETHIFTTSSHRDEVTERLNAASRPLAPVQRDDPPSTRKLHQRTIHRHPRRTHRSLRWTQTPRLRCPARTHPDHLHRIRQHHRTLPNQPPIRRRHHRPNRIRSTRNRKPRPTPRLLPLLPTTNKPSSTPRPRTLPPLHPRLIQQPQKTLPVHHQHLVHHSQRATQHKPPHQIL